VAESGSDVISIKRYPNRRLYDRQARRYITLPELEELVLQGKKIEVRDSKTGEDLTRSILTQILLERHPEKMETFPVAMLHSLLQANDLVLDVFRTYLRQSLAFLEQMQQRPTLSPFLTPMDWMKAVFPVVPFTTPWGGEPLPTPVPDPNLSARLAELEDRIRRLESTSPSSQDLAAVPHGKGQEHRTGPDAGSDTRALLGLEDRLAKLEDQYRRSND
jgi:polyhydroxyalkanoate synthesis repressor PhaR